MRSFFMLFILLSVHCIFAAKLGLYGIITDFGGDNTETIVFTVQIDPATGKWLKIVKNFIYVGGSGTYDGISGYDSDKDVLYYATDFSSPFLFSSDLSNQVLLAPISLGFASIWIIDYDSSQKRLLIYGEISQEDGMGLVSYSTSGGKGELLSRLPEFKSIAGTAIDSANQLYYIIGTNSSAWSIGTVDLTDPDELKSNYPIKCNFSGLYSFEVNTLYYDSDTKNLISIAVTNSPKLAYWLAIIPLSGNGACTAYPIPTSVFGIGTCFTYDQMSKTLWFGFAPNGPSKLISYDVGNLKAGVEFEFSDEVVLEDLQVTYF